MAESMAVIEHNQASTQNITGSCTNHQSTNDREFEKAKEKLEAIVNITGACVSGNIDIMLHLCKSNFCTTELWKQYKEICAEYQKLRRKKQQPEMNVMYRYKLKLTEMVHHEGNEQIQQEQEELQAVADANDEDVDRHITNMLNAGKHNLQKSDGSDQRLWEHYNKLRRRK